MAPVIDMIVAVVIFLVGGLIGASTSQLDQKVGKYVMAFSLVIFVFALIVEYTDIVLMVRAMIYIGVVAVVIALFVGKDYVYQWLVR